MPLWCALAAGLLLGSGAAAEERRFELRIAGLPAARVALAAEEDSDRYAVAARMVATGLVRLFFPLDYEARAEGRRAEGGWQPRAYAVEVQRGSAGYRTEMVFERGTPQVTLQQPPRDWGPQALDPATQAGTVDPLTLIHAMLRDAEDAVALCRLDLAMFDSARRAHFSMQGPAAEGEEMVCRGQYRRVAGYSEEEIARRRAFDLTFHYRPAAGGRYLLHEVRARSMAGPARLIRQ